ncbi:hypothetical protein TRIP_B200008 [uncultured Desulfatiglans sp.]|uniref:Uncharacterized protein n=1 Tax=Uncultured Desulfatiglans sp. TaxID=1748965 RepID=A0A653A1P2_UNCDX|nr:hypothetical protein TRIP_B200008 [uncultured Desulfatiglans sp.]
MRRGLQVASEQTLDFLDIGKKFSVPSENLGCTGKSFRDGDSRHSQRKDAPAAIDHLFDPMRRNSASRFCLGRRPLAADRRLR